MPVVFGKAHHREFATASGERSIGEFVEFLPQNDDAIQASEPTRLARDDSGITFQTSQLRACEFYS